MDWKEEIKKIIFTEPLKKLFWLIVGTIVAIPFVVLKLSGWLQSRLSYIVLLSIALSLLALLLLSITYIFYLRKRLKKQASLKESENKSLNDKKSTDQNDNEPIISLEAIPKLVYLGVDDRDTFQNDIAISWSAAIVEFRNKPIKGRKVASFETVQAQITYYDLTSETHEYINSGSWIGEELNYTSLTIGKARQLIIALQSERGDLSVGVQNSRESDFNQKRQGFVKLTSEKYRVKVVLIDLDKEQEIGDFQFRLTLTRHFSLKLLEPDQYNDSVKQLRAFQDEGKQILDKAVCENCWPEQASSEWTSQVLRFVVHIDDVGEDYAMKFSFGRAMVQHPNRSMGGIQPNVDLLHTKLMRIDEIIKEIEKERDSIWNGLLAMKSLA